MSSLLQSVSAREANASSGLKLTPGLSHRRRKRTATTFLGKILTVGKNV